MSNFLPAAADQSFLPFQFEGMRLQEACFINGNPYFSAKAIGEFLEYKKKRPDVSINQIVQRNPHILDFSVDPKLGSTDGKEYTTRVFDPIGLQLIIFESRQPKAIQYKVAVAHLVYAFMSGKLKPKIYAPDRLSAIKQILSAPPTYKRSALVRELAGKEGKSVQQIYRIISTFGSLKTKKAARRKQKVTAGSYKERTDYMAAIDYRKTHPRAQGKEIKAFLCVTVSEATINRWLRAA